jgi:hypothetical protein
MATMLPVLQPARTRIIRMVNVHFDADDDAIKNFFDGYIIEDWYRTVNVRTKKNSVVYVLFSSAAERVRACGLSGHEFMKRIIKIQPAPTGNYERMFSTLSLSMTHTNEHV